MSKRMSGSVIGLVLLTSLTVACSSDDDDTAADTADAAAGTQAPDETEAPGSEAPAAGSEFTIEGFAFPDGFVATAGEPFTINNVDPAEHTVTSDDFSTGVGSNATATLTVEAAGDYEIRCEIHPNMTGTITVE